MVFQSSKGGSVTALWCIENHCTIWLPQGMFKLVQEKLVLCVFPKSRY